MPCCRRQSQGRWRVSLELDQEISPRSFGQDRAASQRERPREGESTPACFSQRQGVGEDLGAGYRNSRAQTKAGGDRRRLGGVQKFPADVGSRPGQIAVGY